MLSFRFELVEDPVLFAGNQNPFFEMLSSEYVAENYFGTWLRFLSVPGSKSLKRWGTTLGI